MRAAAMTPIRRVTVAAPSLATTKPAKKTVPPSTPTAASETPRSSAIAAAAGPTSPEFQAAAPPKSPNPIRSRVPPAALMRLHCPPARGRSAEPVGRWGKTFWARSRLRIEPRGRSRLRSTSLRASAPFVVASIQSCQLDAIVRSASGATPAAAAVEPLSIAHVPGVGVVEPPLDRQRAPVDRLGLGAAGDEVEVQALDLRARSRAGRWARPSRRPPAGRTWRRATSSRRQLRIDREHAGHVLHRVAGRPPLGPHRDEAEGEQVLELEAVGAGVLARLGDRGEHGDACTAAAPAAARPPPACTPRTPRSSSESTLTPKPMWRCSSRETFAIPSLKPGIVPESAK